MEKAYVTLVEIFYCKNCRAEVEAKSEMRETFYLTFGRKRIYPTYRIAPPRKVCSRCGYPYIYRKGYRYKFVCPSCGKIFYLSEKPEKLKCRNCGKEYLIEERTGTCFIATAVFENSDVYELSILKGFRDNTLTKTAVGRYIIDLYYNFSPQIAERLKKKKFLKILIRKLLEIIVIAINSFPIYRDQ